MPVRTEYFLQKKGDRMDRRCFLKGSLMLAAYSAASDHLFAVEVAAEVAAGTPAAGFRVMPYLQNPSADGMTVMWHTAEPAYGWVEYGSSPELGRMADQVTDGLRQANTTLHKVRLEGLTAGAPCFYRVCFKPIRSFGAYRVDFDAVVASPLYSFKTLPPRSAAVKCAIFNDLHRNFDVFHKLSANFKERSCDFSFFNGDCFPDYNDDESLLKAISIFNCGVEGHSRPMLCIRGNHETRGASARRFKEKLDFPENQFFFAMSAGPVRFIVLDCGEDKPDDSKEYSGLTDFTGFRAQQAAWLQREVESEGFQQAVFRVLVHHIPLYQAGDKHISRLARELWDPILKEAPIDLAVCGHVHRCSYLPAGEAGNRHPVLVGGGPADNGVLFLLSADDRQLELESLDVNGKRVGLYRKQAGQALECVSERR